MRKVGDRGPSADQTGFRVQGIEFRVQGLGFRVFRV